MDERAAVEAIFREEHGRLLASLVRRFGDLDLAEEVASEAIEAALVHWPVEGVPARPGAWLLTTARRRAVNRLRRDQAYAARLAVLQVEADRAGPVPPATMAQRIVRAKKKIREARIPFRVPGADELPERLPGVLQVIYSIFTEGYAASAGTRLQRLDLAEEAIRLARILRRLLPVEREVSGLLGLMLLIHARRDARTDRGGPGPGGRRSWRSTTYCSRSRRPRSSH